MSNVSSRNPIEEERTVDTPNTRARKIEEYMKRYEALQQERLRSFGRRASDDFGLEEEEVSLSKVNEHDDLPSVFKSKQNQPYEEYEEHEEQEKQQQQQQDEGEEEDLFSVFPSRTIQAFPHVSDTTNTTNKSSSMSKVSPYNRKKVKLQESFMDAGMYAFMHLCMNLGKKKN
jgi:hypothetical protein